MTLDRAGIARLVPHQGAMCLLHEVLEADAQRIVCRAVNHRDPAHPLREAGTLHALCGVEYAAQAMAVHGALHGVGHARRGMLAALRNVELTVQRLDDLAEDLTIEAQCLVNEGSHLVYTFFMKADHRELLRGRATVVLSA